MNRRMKIASAMGAVVVAAGIGSGAAYAAIPDSGSGVITGCYSGVGTLRVIDAQGGATCLGSETTLTWGQTGPQGPAGPNDLSVTSGTHAVTFVGGTDQSFSLSCPTGDKFVSAAIYDPNMPDGLTVLNAGGSGVSQYNGVSGSIYTQNYTSDGSVINGESYLLVPNSSGSTTLETSVTCLS